MADVLTPEQRRLNMSRIRGKDTKPELQVRRGLHAMGFRFRLHSRSLPGRPDLVFPGRHAAVFVHGCFWHGHYCPLCRLPSTRQEFWKRKIEGNRARDARVAQALSDSSWRVMTIWECSIRGRARRPLTEVLDRCGDFLNGDRRGAECAGAWDAIS